MISYLRLTWRWSLVLILSVVCWPRFVAFADDIPTESVGKLTVVIPPNTQQGLNYFPDEQISIIGKNPIRMLVVSGNSTLLLQGPNIAQARPRKVVFMPGNTTDFDNGYAGITSVVPNPSGKRKLLGFYHAEDHVDMPKVSYNKDIQGAYWSIGLAHSDDNGESFTRGGQILRASVAKKDVTKEHQGIGDPHVILDASGEYLYAYYTDITRRKGDEPIRVALARCAIADRGEPGKWFKYRHGKFEEPGLGGEEDGIVRGPTTYPCESGSPHVTYLPRWKRYVMVFTVLAYADFEKQKGDQGGIFWCLSEDGLKWTEPRQLCSGLPVPLTGKEYIAHPTLMIDSATETTAKAQLYFAYSPRWGTQAPDQPHHLARRSVTLSH